MKHRTLLALSAVAAVVMADIAVAAPPGGAVVRPSRPALFSSRSLGSGPRGGFRGDVGLRPGRGRGQDAFFVSSRMLNGRSDVPFYGGGGYGFGGGFGGYGVGGGFPGFGYYGHYASGLAGQYRTGRIPVPPYFALHPPVYYSELIRRPYGGTPFAAYPGPAGWAPPAQTIINPTMPQPSEEDSESEVQLDQVTKGEMIINPYYNAVEVLGDGQLVTASEE